MKTKRPIPSAAMALMLMLMLMLCTAAACKNNDPAPAAVQEQPQPSLAAGGCQPFEELAGLDHRTPVPLQPMMAWHQKQNMMEHLVAIQRITDSLAREDWEGWRAHRR
ncbi:MAG: hypothetical protein IPK13_11820 [Deltaproteobacteria bacterium]|nr:hypothetical protein [Deltaproteobacteria bacterium]